MKKILSLGLLAGLFALGSCQNELYEDASKNTSDLGAYISSDESTQIFAEENKEVSLKNVVVSLSQKVEEEHVVTVELGSQTQLDAYNKKHGTEYLLLPAEMYDVVKELKFKKNQTSQFVPITLKDIEFSLKGTYALPVSITGGSVPAISGQTEALVILEQRINTKVLRLKGSGSEDAKMFPNDFKVDKWTMEAMINRAKYVSNNQSIGGTKLVEGSSMLDEIYPRFGDVTIKPNQLQLKTGNSQIDVPADKFSAKPDEWYMIAFVYDGQKNYIYVNGELVADREIRTGPYGLVGFWISGANDLIREVRFWKTARTQQQLKSYMWKMVDGDDDDLLLYYPMNGKKRDVGTGEVTEDETKIWDWSKSGKHLSMPSGAKFDDNGGDGFIFPEED